ncbi:LysM peptidoglycan-binding domain-containing protein [bacterium]|nr:LysM peptidoglycan-binding domain-containing protein [bacterium]
MRKKLPITHILLLALLPVFLFSCSIQIVDRDSVKSSERMRGVYHRVKPGETLWRISKAYNVDLQELAEINNVTDASRISAGSVVFIPDVPRVIDLPPVKSPVETRTVAVKQPEKPVAAKAEPETGRAGPEAAGAAAGAVSAGGRSKVKEESIMDRAPATKPERSPASAKPPEKTTARTVETPEKADSGKTQLAMKPPAPPPPVKTPDTSLKESAAVSPPAKKPEPVPRAEEPQGQIHIDKGRFMWPLKGPVITRFGIQPSGMKYNGIKIAAKEGVPVQAAAAGTIIYASYVKGYGDTLIVKHDENYTTVYAYLKGSVAKKDDRVKKGEKIASVGPSQEPGGEPYLYFEIREKNKARNPQFFLP